MIRINLLTAEEVQRAVGRRQEMAVGALLLALAGAVFFMAHSWQYYRLGGAQRELTRLEKELAAIQGPYGDVTRMEQQKKELRDKLRVIAQLEAKKVGPVRLLADLSAATPDKLWLTEFSENEGTIRLAGLGVDEQTVADFMRRLGASPYFRGVDLEETSQVTQEGIKHKKFVIRGGVSYLDAAASAPTATAPRKPGTAAAGGGRGAAAGRPRQ